MNVLVVCYGVVVAAAGFFSISFESSSLSHSLSVFFSNLTLKTDDHEKETITANLAECARVLAVSVFISLFLFFEPLSGIEMDKYTYLCSAIECA